MQIGSQISSGKNVRNIRFSGILRVEPYGKENVGIQIAPGTQVWLTAEHLKYFKDRFPQGWQMPTRNTSGLKPWQLTAEELFARYVDHKLKNKESVLARAMDSIIKDGLPQRPNPHHEWWA